jgi:RNA polymerase sporulation-specific sigma factor
VSDIEAFRPLAYVIAREFFLPGADRDDLRQEAMIGVWKGLRDFREGQGTTRKSFVSLCVRRQLITAVKTATRDKHRAFNEALRDMPTAGDDDPTLLGMLASPGADPAHILEERERVETLLTAVAHDLTPLERRVLIAFVNGSTMREIAEEVGGTTARYPDGSPRPKRVENALERARAKLASPPTVAALAA